MKKFAKSLAPATVLAIALLSISPMVSASTLTVNLNPSTHLAKVTSSSVTKIVFTYPAGSDVSKYLENVSSTVKLNSSFMGGSNGAMELQDSFEQDDSHVSVQNMTVSIDYTAKGSATELDINKVTNVTAWVSGVFSVVNGTVVADLHWRSFVVLGAMNLDMENQNMDINTVGSTMQTSLASQAIAAGFLFNNFGDRSVWGQSTLNFSQLSTPLSTWTKNYDSSTNTTTFSKTITGTSTFTASLDVNSQHYSLSVSSDPTGVVSMQGYANAQGDTLIVAPAPAPYAGFAEVGVVVMLLGAAAGYFVFRARRTNKNINTKLPV